MGINMFFPSKMIHLSKKMCIFAGVMGRKLRKWVLAAGLWAVSSLTAQALRAATGEDLPKQGTVREEQGFKLRKATGVRMRWWGW